MGALTPQREAAETKFENMKSVVEEPFHYGTHFNSSMIVCHFLIRLFPFNENDQNVARRRLNNLMVFSGRVSSIPHVQPILIFFPIDLPRAYLSAVEDVRGDVRELIPEFFTCAVGEMRKLAEFGFWSSTTDW